MLVLQIFALLWIVVCLVGFNKLLSELYSIRQWIQHVNEKLTGIERSSEELVAGGRR